MAAILRAGAMAAQCGNGVASLRHRRRLFDTGRVACTSTSPTFACSCSWSRQAASRRCRTRRARPGVCQRSRARHGGAGRRAAARARPARRAAHAGRPRPAASRQAGDAADGMDAGRPRRVRAWAERPCPPDGEHGGGRGIPARAPRRLPGRPSERRRGSRRAAEHRRDASGGGRAGRPRRRGRPRRCHGLGDLPLPHRPPRARGARPAMPWPGTSGCRSSRRWDATSSASPATVPCTSISWDTRSVPAAGCGSGRARTAWTWSVAWWRSGPGIAVVPEAAARRCQEGYRLRLVQLADGWAERRLLRRRPAPDRPAAARDGGWRRICWPRRTVSRRARCRRRRGPASPPWRGWPGSRRGRPWPCCRSSRPGPRSR